MVEAKTQLILESIKKKMEKLEEPRTQANKDFSDLGDEFSYSAPTKKSAAVVAPLEEKKSVPTKPEPTADEVAIEKEIDNSFQFDDEESAEQHAAEPTVDAAPVPAEMHEEHHDEETHEEVVEEHEEVQEEIHEEQHKEVEHEAEVEADEEHHDEETHEEEHVEDLPLTEEPEEHSETEEHHDDFDFNHDDLPDLDLEEDEEEHVAEEEEDEVVDNEEEHEEEILEVKKPNIKSNEQAKQEDEHKSDEDELEALLKEEASRTKAAAPIMPTVQVQQSSQAPIAQVASQAQTSQMAMPTQVAQSIPSVPPTAETPAKKMFSDMNEFLNHTDSATKAGDSLLNTQAASTVTDSIKKLVDAKNVVSGVTSFSKSEAFGDIASQLMEPRLEKWLNENLPALVEKIVREEIKKIIPKE